jgi:hypothetical protein
VFVGVGRSDGGFGLVVLRVFTEFRSFGEFGGLEGLELEECKEFMKEEDNGVVAAVVGVVVEDRME